MKLLSTLGYNLLHQRQLFYQFRSLTNTRVCTKNYNVGCCFDVDELCCALATGIRGCSMQIVKVFTTILVVSLGVSVVDNLDGDYLVGRSKIYHRADELSEEQFLKLGPLSDVPHLRETVKHILLPRVVDTAGHTQARKHIVDSLRELSWSVEIDKFHETVPILGKLHFHNIIATLNPNAERYLVLGCHYDSKYFADFEFIGATDSAVPCAMLVNMAHVLHDVLQPFRSTKLSLMFIFFDGEEAFKEWGPHDSIYGARHLAKRWEADGTIERLDMLMLLDLIGAADPTFYSMFANTESWYSRLVSLEERLSQAGHLERYISNGISRQYPNRYFQPNTLRSSNVEDDHLPFLQRRVPVLHLITLPFPNVWHTKDDNESIIDYAATENISRIIRLFIMEYLHGALPAK